MTRPGGARKIANLAAVLALTGVALVAWSVADPAPLAVVLAMTVGQVVGTASLLLLLVAIVVDLRGQHILPVDPSRRD